jgi:hypothetical protein
MSPPGASALAVPPAWKDVRWREVRDEVKDGRLLAFADALPRIQAAGCSRRGSAGNGVEPEEAAVVRLIARHARTELRRSA